MSFLVRNYRKFAVLSVLFLCVYLAGCGPLTWLSDATKILPIVGSMISALLAFIGMLTGSTVPAAIAVKIQTVIGNALKGIQDIEAMVSEYQKNPSTTLLGSIEQGTKAVIDNITQFLADTGITDTATQSKVVALLQLVLNEVVAFQTLLPALQAQAGDQITVTVPMTSDQAKAAFNKIIATPTGNPSVDGALAKIHRL